MCDRRAIRTDGRRLALEGGEPSVGPLDESDRRTWPIDAVLDGGHQAMQGDLSLLAVPSNGFSVCVLSDTYDRVVETALPGRYSRPRPDGMASKSAQERSVVCD